MAADTYFIDDCEAPIAATEPSEPERLTLEYYHRLGGQLMECKRVHSESDYLHSLRLAGIMPAYANSCMAVATKYTAAQVSELPDYTVRALIDGIFLNEQLNEWSLKQ